MAADRQDWQACDGESASSSLAFSQATLTREPFPVVVADGIICHGSVPVWDRLMIDRDWHLEQSINGQTLTIPDYLDCAICDEDKGWQDRVCQYLRAIDDRNRDYVFYRLEIIGEHDISGDIFAVLFVPADCADRLWCQDTFIVCDGKLQEMDGSIGDSNFLDNHIGWHVADLQTGDYLAECERETQRYSAGYSHDPTGELERDLIGEPVWHYGLNCFVGRLRCNPHPVRLYPETPCYGG